MITKMTRYKSSFLFGINMKIFIKFVTFYFLVNKKNQLKHFSSRSNIFIFFLLMLRKSERVVATTENYKIMIIFFLLCFVHLTTPLSCNEFYFLFFFGWVFLVIFSKIWKNNFSRNEIRNRKDIVMKVKFLME